MQRVSEEAESKYICDTIQKITQSGVSESHIAGALSCELFISFY